MARLQPSLVAHTLAVRALETASQQWSNVVAWHRSTDVAVAAVVQGRAQSARCAMVGDSLLLTNSLGGSEIDGDDEVVLRFNFAPIAGFYEACGSADVSPDDTGAIECAGRPSL